MKLYSGVKLQECSDNLISALDVPCILCATDREDMACSFTTEPNNTKNNNKSIYAYNLNLDKDSGIKILEYKEINDECIDFYLKLRHNIRPELDYDLVIAPLVNEKISVALALYELNIIDKDEFKRRVSGGEVAYMYSFISEKSLDVLEYDETIDTNTTTQKVQITSSHILAASYMSFICDKLVEQKKMSVRDAMDLIMHSKMYAYINGSNSFGVRLGAAALYRMLEKELKELVSSNKNAFSYTEALFKNELGKLQNYVTDRELFVGAMKA